MMNQAWIQEHVDSFIAENREALLRDMKTVIDIDSVEAPAEPNAPYGAGVRKALDAALAIARDLGLSTGPPSPIWMWCRPATAGTATPSI